MALTCDILHYGSSSPDISAVPLTLYLDWPAGHRGELESSALNRWTHLGVMPIGTDVRDAYGPPAIGQDGTGLGCDTIYVPSFPGGTAFYAIFVTRRQGGKYVYLQRTAIVSWPTDDL